MKHLMTLLALVVAVTAGAQVMDTILTGNTIYMNLNYAKLDSVIADLQAKVATLEAAQTSTFDGDYNSLTNQPAIPSNVSDLTNDAGFTTVSQADSIAVGVAWRGELSGADLAEASLSSADLSGADLSGADLSGANLYDANLYVADLSGANLSSANLTSADLSGADLSGANLTDAYLSYAQFVVADLSGANLSGASLTGANLTGADLSGANLTDAYLFGANLTNANLTGVTWTGAYIGNCPGCTCVDSDNDNFCD